MVWCEAMRAQSATGSAGRLEASGVSAATLAMAGKRKGGKRDADATK